MSGERPGDWLPLVDYAVKKGVSLSTLRRYIKSNKVRYRLENGRYLILDDAISSSATLAKDVSPDILQKVKKLERDLQKAQEEIVELKTLVALYEEKIPSRLNS